MGLRDEHRELTRRTVMRAVLELVAEGSLDELSVPNVARRSGVSVATIYRYFPTKDALLSAAADEPSRLALEQAGPTRPGDDEFASFQRAMWHGFSSNLALLRHQVASQAGRDMREARLERSVGLLRFYLDGQGVATQGPDADRLIALLVLITGSLALVELHDRQGLPVDEAVDHTQWAAHVLIEATRRHHQEDTP
jgi:AcrR family transcriptional regulator